MKKKIKKAFSLIELLISLVIISLIAAAFTPVLSRKLVSGKVALNAKGVKIDCAQKYGEDCVMCNDKACLWCTTYINIPKGQYVDPALGCERKFCKDKYGETCTSCTKDWCTGCRGGYGFNSSSHTCYICLAPTSSSGDENPCRTCDNGYEYQDANEQINCKICDTANGYFPNSDRKGCTQVKCNKGYKRDGSGCKICDAGYYQSSDNYSGTTCSYCGGTKQYSSSGASGCSSCPTGQVANSYHTGCVQKTCPSGQNLVGDDCITPAAPAPAPETPDEPSKSWQKPTTQADCSPFGAIYYNGLCITSKNPGDGGPSIAGIDHLKTGVTAAVASQQSNGCPSGKSCCWQGNTHGSGDSSGHYTTSSSCYCSLTAKLNSGQSPYNYPGCERSLCNYDAGVKICSSYAPSPYSAGSWRLPTQSEIGGWSAASVGLGSNGLQLCSNQSQGSNPSSKDYISCHPGERCKGATADSCRGFIVYTSTPSGDKVYALKIEGSSSSVTAVGKRNAASVRCVTDKVYK